jgi:hypothetical protein
VFPAQFCHGVYCHARCCLPVAVARFLSA